MTTGPMKATLVACVCVSFLFGILHAFSLYVVPLETAFSASRSAVSFTYSLAVLTLALTVMQGHRFYAVWSPARFCAAVLGLGAAGLWIAATAQVLWQVWLGYGIVYGVANGLGYGFALQFSARAWPARTGMAMGLVTAAYGLGASSSPIALDILIRGYDWRGALGVQGLAMVAAAPLIWVLLRKTEVQFVQDGTAVVKARFLEHWTEWLAYGAAVFAGLMVLSQASEILREGGASAQISVAGPIVASGAGLIGAFLGGYYADRIPERVIVRGLPPFTALALVLMAGYPVVWVLILGLAAVGFCYGATIAAYPALIALRYAGSRGIAVYGVVFTAWGLAGVLGPWTAGALFDARGSYSAALIVAAVFALGSSVVQMLRR
jgi:OFA family oxalate/formate antiporter-like MFS transporter